MPSTTIMNENTLYKTELFVNILKLSVLSLGGFFTMKWLMNQLDPTNSQKKQAKKKAQQQFAKIGIPEIANLTDYEMMIASHLVDPADISVEWSNIAGLDDVIQEIKETVILPIQRRDLFFGSHLSQPPKGVLLHGPPGCGKTMIAKATAREAGMRFINLDVSILTDKWYGESQKLAAAVFSLSVKLQPCIIFIDEIDSLLRNRSSQDHEATAMMKAQFMSLWDGLVTNPDCTVIVMGATNRPHDLDRAILRRMPATFYVHLPDEEQRKEILELLFKGEPLSEDVDILRLAVDAEGFSGSDLRELCRNASIYRIRDYLRKSSRSPTNNDSNDNSTLRPITMTDLITALQKMKDSKFRCGPEI